MMSEEDPLVGTRWRRKADGTEWFVRIVWQDIVFLRDKMEPVFVADCPLRSELEIEYERIEEAAN
jgi:hypothetical protein